MSLPEINLVVGLHQEDFHRFFKYHKHLSLSHSVFIINEDSLLKILLDERKFKLIITCLAKQYSLKRALFFDVQERFIITLNSSKLESMEEIETEEGFELKSFL